MYSHNLDPVLINLGFIAIRWYSLAYIFGIVIGWWLGKKILNHISNSIDLKFTAKDFDDLITYIIISLIIGGRLGYVIFYNLDYYISNPFDILKIWEGGMSFHGAMIGIILGTYLFSKKKIVPVFIILDIISCVSPIGIFLGRIANFINGELIGKATTVPWSVIFSSTDMVPRHPSQLYEAMLEYKMGTCSYLFLIFYGIFRIISELFREPDVQVGYLFNLLSMGTILSFLMILAGLFLKKILTEKNENQ